jgi:ABC-2 type transport system permease protein
MDHFFLAAFTLWRRELVRFYRQPSRVVGALGSPLIFWLLIGSGIGSSFRSEADGSGYLAFFFPGTLLLILFFTAIFTTISIIEDRREGFLQGVLVAPISRASLVFGKILGGSTLAFIQAFLFLMLAPFVGIKLTISVLVITCLVLFLNAFVMTALGFLLAWQFNSIQGFHAMMNLLLMPMWILSGALFPREGASEWMQWVMSANPLSYGLTALRISLFGNPATSTDSFAVSILISIIFGVIIFILSTASAIRPSIRDLK